MHDGSVAAGVTPRYGRKREAIVSAATEILNRCGVKGMTLALVAEQVGLITTSVTYYFKKKEDLASACFLAGIERLEALVAEAGKHEGVEARLHALLDLYLGARRRIREGSEPPIPIFSDVRALEGEHQVAVGKAYAELFLKVQRLFRGAGLDLAGVAARTHTLLEQVHWCEAWLHRYDPEDYPRVRDRMLDILMRGFAPEGASWPPQRLAPALGRGDDFRETFLLAATRLINQRGYRGASVEKISASLNVTKGSFYHHHQAKDDVVVACFQRSFEMLRQVQSAARGLDADQWTKLASAASAVVAFQRSDEGPLLRTSALSALPESIRLDMVEQSNRVSDRWAAMISDGIAEGSLRAVDPFIGAQMLGAALNASADLRFLPEGLATAEAVDLYAQSMLMGLPAR